MVIERPPAFEDLSARVFAKKLESEVATHDSDHLRTLRNDVPVRLVLADLRIPTKNRGRPVNFRCPACAGFHASINPQANLLRCFRCSRDFNPIDLVETECHCRFLEAVRRVESLMVSCP